MNQKVEPIEIVSDFTNRIKIIGVGSEGEAAVNHIYGNKDISADFFAISSGIQDALKVTSVLSYFNIKSLKQDIVHVAPDYDEIEKIIGCVGVVFFIFSIEDSTAIKTVSSISKVLRNKVTLCGICRELANKNISKKNLEILNKQTDFMLFLPAEECLDSNYNNSEKLATFAETFYSPIYALTKLMEDEVVVNHYDWAEFNAFANSNKKTAFRHVVVRREGDSQSAFEDTLHKTFNFKSLSNINPMELKHALVHITSGEIVKPVDYIMIGNQLDHLHKNGVVPIPGFSIDMTQHKDVIEVAILLIGRDPIEGEIISLESEETFPEEFYQIPEFLIKDN